MIQPLQVLAQWKAACAGRTEQDCLKDDICAWNVDSCAAKYACPKVPS
jgi:hypothetical protein